MGGPYRCAGAGTAGIAALGSPPCRPSRCRASSPGRARRGGIRSRCTPTLREQDPVHHVADGDYWVLSRHADVFRAARDTATFSSAQGLTFFYGEIERLGIDANRPMVMMDPPEHTAFRRLVAARVHASPGRRDRARGPCVRRRSRSAELRERGDGDVVDDVVQTVAEHGRRPLPRCPARRIAHRFDGWTDAIVAANAAGDVAGAATRWGSCSSTSPRSSSAAGPIPVTTPSPSWCGPTTDAAPSDVRI